MKTAYQLVNVLEVYENYDELKEIVPIFTPFIEMGTSGVFENINILVFAFKDNSAAVIFEHTYTSIAFDLDIEEHLLQFMSLIEKTKETSSTKDLHS